MNNCSTWTEISNQSIEDLEGLQHLFFRLLFQVPKGTPKIAYIWDTTTLSMEMRIWKEKLNFYKYLQHLPDNTLAKEVFDEQRKCGFPGLVKECEVMAKELNIIAELKDESLSTHQFKQLVRSAIDNRNEQNLRREMKRYSLSLIHI